MRQASGHRLLPKQPFYTHHPFSPRPPTLPRTQKSQYLGMAENRATPRHAPPPKNPIESRPSTLSLRPGNVHWGSSQLTQPRTARSFRHRTRAPTTAATCRLQQQHTRPKDQRIIATTQPARDTYVRTPFSPYITLKHYRGRDARDLHPPAGSPMPHIGKPQHKKRGRTKPSGKRVLSPRSLPPTAHSSRPRGPRLGPILPLRPT
ncbi:hypothetical protein LX32DRAFT_204367 [Colletotrichum zoysiae]|uniref:Uncharacterized protein n=1 Tax=Colletotrichum zoysiae TaxID=1216348 RepID=A0AAD9H663_9PEZI|nr:hypothetical protein LX32DRAFT_204367 [Colletotrichum zoysiae]